MIFMLSKSFLNIATRKFKLTCMACIIFLLECWIFIAAKNYNVSQVNTLGRNLSRRPDGNFLQVLK